MRMKEGTIIGLIAGTAIGIAIGSFLSSEEGKQFRRDVKDKVSEHLKNLENDFAQEMRRKMFPKSHAILLKRYETGLHEFS